MDSKYYRLPSNLVLSIKNEFHLKYFVETGTYVGNTARWASQHFDRVFTIENSEMLWQQASTKYSGLDNIQFILGDSRHMLCEVVEKLESPAIFWLDAHWSVGITYGEGNECPLAEELQIVVNNSYDHFILVDDARMFLAPPPKPHTPDQWPDIVSVINILNSNRARFIVVIDDVIVAVPAYARSLLTEYCQDVNIVAALRDQGKKPVLGKTLRRLYHSFIKV